ncbi:MAG: HAD-IA family hydrolase [Pseudomonadota bacterium]
MAKRGAIFDLDGTLADTAEDLLNAANAALAPHQLPLLSLDQDRSFAGRGGRSMIRRSLEKAGLDPDAPAQITMTNNLYPDLITAYSDGIAVHTHLFDGVEACLDALADQGWALGVCTNKPEALALRVLDALGILGRFGSVLGADTLPIRKPDPVHLQETARRCGADPVRSVLVGDTMTDLRTARAARVPCILTSFGFAAEPLRELDPDAIVSHYSEIPDVLDRFFPLAGDA